MLLQKSKLLKYLTLTISLGLLLYSLQDLLAPNVVVSINQGQIQSNTSEGPNVVHEDIKYILMWTSMSVPPFSILREGRNCFVKHKCKFTNCYFTNDKNFFLNLQDFDAILFNGMELNKKKRYKKIYRLPCRRSPKQKYVFAAMESAHYFPICQPFLDSYFNWTWTYKLDSDLRWGYLNVYDLEGNLVGPKHNMNWPATLEPTSKGVLQAIKDKSLAAAWFVSNCHTPGKREDFASDLKKELKVFDLQLDIYGSCGELKCPRNNETYCNNKLKKDYYFYLSFENSFAEDYVTEKLQTALENYAVPIVYGGANYSRFLPPGSYLNARELGPKKLAETMNEIINNKTRYNDFFRWRNHYKYVETASSIDICNFCALLNDQEKFNSFSLKENFRQWWNRKDAHCDKK